MNLFDFLCTSIVLVQTNTEVILNNNEQLDKTSNNINKLTNNDSLDSKAENNIYILNSNTKIIDKLTNNESLDSTVNDNIQLENNAELFNKNDFNSHSTFLVFLYYQKPDFICPLCDEFKNSLNKLEITIKTLNFAENVEMASRFLQHTFPAFIMRHENKSYVLDPKNFEELDLAIKSSSWKQIVPVKSRIDVNSLFAIAFSKVNRLIFYGVQGFYYLNKIIPDYFITIFIILVIGFLSYSIADVLLTNEISKEKRE